MDLDDFLARLDGVQHQPKGIAARCPAHHDTVASLSVNEGEAGGVVVKCHAGCQTADVVAAMGLTLRDLMGKPHITAEYTYVDEAGRPLWVVERWANPKTFRCRPGLPPAAERVLYHADALATARQRGGSVYLTEGEKDADRLVSLGYVATTNVGGADAWLSHYAQQLAGCHVIVVADNDEPGRRHAREVVSQLTSTAASVRLVVPRYGKDASDLLDLGWTLDALDPLSATETMGVVASSMLRPRPHEWAWQGYVAFGAVTIVEGDPGDGKSMLVLDLAARWSSGAPMPDGSNHAGPYGILVANAEDDPESTIVPRLKLAGADMDRVHIMLHGTEPDRPISLRRDLPAMSRFVIEHNVRFVIIDPLMAFLDDDTDSHSDHSVRRALYPLYRLARDTGAAVIVVRHLNKGQGKAIYRGGGSIGFIGAARSAYAVGPDPEDDGRRILACVKMNIAPRPESHSFSIEDVSGNPVIRWHGAIDKNAQDVVDGRFNPDDAEIIQFLNSVVEDEPLVWRDICKFGREQGWTEAKLRNRRGRSRLMKIIGEEGNRSVRWGYLKHTTAATAHLQALAPLSPSEPTFPLSKGGSGEANGNDATPAGPLAPADPHPESGNMATDGESGPRYEQEATPSTTVDDDDARLTQLDARPLVCDICSTTTNVSRFAHPYWAIRCVPHNPFTFGGQP